MRLSLFPNSFRKPQRSKLNETILYKTVYQTNRQRMYWVALGMVIIRTVATIVEPARMAKADSILMAHYLAMSGLVGAYFALGNKGEKSAK